MRPIGWRATNAWRTSSVDTWRVRASAIRCSSDGDSIVPGRSRCSGCPLDEIGGHRLGQADHGRLGGAVDEAVGHALHARRGRRHVDDRRAARFEHRGQQRADQPVHRRDVQVQRERPRFVVAVEDRAVVHEARAVEQHVERVRSRRAPRRPARPSSSRRVASRPRARRSAASSRTSAASLMSVASTSAPSLANRSAVARPMPCPAAVTSARLPCNLMSTSRRSRPPVGRLAQGLKVQPILGSDSAFVTESGFSIYPGGEIGLLSKDSTFDAPGSTPGFGQINTGGPSSRFFSHKRPTTSRQTDEKSCSRQGLNGMRAPS